MRVLIVDPVSASCQLLEKLLRSGGAVAEHTDLGAEAIELARRGDYDAVLAEFRLPDMSGCDLVRRLRAARIDMPVMLLTAQGQPQSRVQAFGAGADDVVTRLCDPAELLARLRAIVRRNRGHSRSLLQCGPVRLDMDTRQAWVVEQAVRVTGKEFAVLELLVLRRGMVLSKEVFLNHLYGGMDEPEAKIIDVFICKLRRKLTEAGAPNVIGTIWGRGYTMRDADNSTIFPTVSSRPALEAAASA